MPKCIDDPSRSYKGNEPSPKGLGYCSHTQAVGTSKTGNDGNIWTVETTYKGTKRWVKKSVSSKRVSKKKTSGKRRSPKRTSKKKTSKKRRSTRRTSKKKTSGKRKSPKKVSKKKESSLHYNENMTREEMARWMKSKEFLRWMKQIDKRPKTYEKTENGTYPISWNIGSDLKENEIYTSGTSILLYSKNDGYRMPTHQIGKTLTMKKSEIRKKVRNIIKEIQKDKNLKKINKVQTHFKPFLYRGKPEKGAMIGGIDIYYS